MTTPRSGSNMLRLLLVVGLWVGGTACGNKHAGSRVDGSAGNAGSGGTGGATGGSDAGGRSDGGGSDAGGDVVATVGASQWVQAAGSSMPGRWLHTVRALRDKLFLVGGESSGSLYSNDVWSSADGRSWQLVTDQAAFPKRASHGMAVFNDKLWVVGGSFVLNADVWSSSDGATWIEATSAAPFGRRRLHTVEAFAGQLWVIAGSENGAMGDVWSSGDGVTWTLANPSAFPPRRGHASAVAGGKLWVFGGEGKDGKRLGDVWSSADGVTWSKMTDQGFPGRILPGAGVLGNELWIVGGEGDRGLNAVGALENHGPLFTDVWSSPDGIQWTRRVASTPFPGHVASVTMTFGERLLVLGGWRVGYGWGLLSSVWATSDGLSWGELGMGEPFVGRHSFGSAAVNGKLFVAGGIGGLDGRVGDVWSSLDGARWEKQTDAAPFGRRSHHALVTHDERLWLIAGETGSFTDGDVESHSDVWFSVDGATWTLATAQAPFAARWGLASLVFDGRVWVIGGNTSSGPPGTDSTGAGPTNDVWWSKNGAEWTRATARAAFSPRYGHAVAAYAGKMWLAGGGGAPSIFGDPDETPFELWSSSDGSTWTQEPSPPVTGTREGHVLVAHAGRLWLVGGQRPGGGYHRDVWTFDGTAWKQDNPFVPFPSRMHAAGVAFNERIWILGGAERGIRDDVWWSK